MAKPRAGWGQQSPRFLTGRALRSEPREGMYRSFFLCLFFYIPSPPPAVFIHDNACFEDGLRLCLQPLPTAQAAQGSQG